MPRFIQLTNEDCTYLLNLIEDMDSETAYTELQRSYTVPKLAAIAQNPSAARLAPRDIGYLIELVEDDTEESLEQQRCMTQATLLEIYELQVATQNELRSREQQRSQRRARRAPATSLQEHFAQTRTD